MHGTLIFIYLLLGGFLGGLAATLVSMASLVTYPILLSIGIPPVFANTTDDAAFIWNGLGSTMAATKQLKGHYKKAIGFSILAIIGSAIGCLLLLHFPAKVFEKVVPFCLLLSGILVLVAGNGKFKIHNHAGKFAKFMSLLAIMVTGLYGGYFGAASGVLMLAILEFVMDDDFLTVNAVRNIVNCASDGTAFVIYAFASKIYWLQAIPLAIGILIGSYVGVKLLGKIPEMLIKVVTAILAFGQAGYFFYTAFIK